MPRQGRENEVVAELRRVFPDAVLADLDKRNVKVIYEQFLMYCKSRVLHENANFLYFYGKTFSIAV